MTKPALWASVSLVAVLLVLAFPILGSDSRTASHSTRVRDLEFSVEAPQVTRAGEPCTIRVCVLNRGKEKVIVATGRATFHVRAKGLPLTRYGQALASRRGGSMISECLEKGESKCTRVPLSRIIDTTESGACRFSVHCLVQIGNELQRIWIRNISLVVE